MSGFASSRSGSSSSAACRKAPGSSPPKRSSTISQYQQRHDIVVGPAKDLPPQLADSIKRAAKRIYRTLDLDGYARIDFRLSADGIPYYIEANPNPEIARSEEFASAAKHDGLDYPELIQRILALGISRAGATGIAL